jgi:hypothetical protein
MKMNLFNVFLSLLTSISVVCAAFAPNNDDMLFTLLWDANVPRILRNIAGFLDHLQDPATMLELIVQNQNLTDAAMVQVIAGLAPTIDNHPAQALALLRDNHPDYVLSEEILNELPFLLKDPGCD